ncbi:hypothetical protein PCC7424_2658 [Gloeothece citriformis PCC 7424]|uniref:YggT family protein n=1 Tax=Gloeothece citriformis (strain PCC 7424) TaxID=65393 RepID=B7KKV1_GLOC7|nr:YggT family protein [Gloeothece citriformis]ACK71070.1 hypothetical protein PCC7424_2658 [Gloeothece citriformis PCC 7424]
MSNPNHEQNAHESTTVDKYIGSPSTLEREQEQQKLKREKRRLAQVRFDLIFDKIISSIYIIVVTIELLLGFRFILQLAEANPDNTFANVIKGISEPFAAPFSNLFNNGSENSLFDGGLLVGMLVYWLLGMMIIWILGLLKN